MIELPSKQRVLVTGLTGQDGYYLAKLLVPRGCEIVALVHEAEMESGRKIQDELGPLQLQACDLKEPAAVDAAVERWRPEIVYHLGAQSSVQRSWENPLETAQVNTLGTICLLDAVRRHCAGASLVFAGSCDCFDHQAAGPGGLTPQTPLRATNPYATSKVMAQQYIQYYRQEFGLRASVAIFFNHTSPRRPEHFVEMGIVAGAVRVKRGEQEALVVGSLDTVRDWSWAPEIVDAFGRMGAMETPRDLVLASGRTRTVGDWVREAFAQLGLDVNRQVRVDPARCHPGDRPHTFGNIEETKRVLGWEPRMGLREMVRELIRASE